MRLDFGCLVAVVMAFEATCKCVLWVVKTYVSRRRVEEAAQFIEQNYNLDKVRVQIYSGLRNMTTLVMASVKFIACHVGLRRKVEILVSNLLDASQRVYSIVRISETRLWPTASRHYELSRRSLAGTKPTTVVLTSHIHPFIRWGTPM